MTVPVLYSDDGSVLSDVAGWLQGLVARKVEQYYDITVTVVVLESNRYGFI